MKLSIVVLTRNRLPMLRECLARICAYTATRPAELIVIDNASTDGTREFLESGALRDGCGVNLWHIRRPTNEGVCARNYGIDVAEGEFIAQVDDDVLVSPGWDRVLLEPMEDSREIGATGQEAFYQCRAWDRTPYSAGLIDDRRRPSPGQRADFVMGYAWAWRNVRPFDRCPEEDEEPIGEPHPDTGLLACEGCSGEGRGDCAAIMGDPKFRYDEQFNPFWHEESDLQLQIRAAGLHVMCVRSVATHRPVGHERPQAEDLELAERNFRLLRAKWARDDRVIYEGKAVGL